ncbi:hypothetical protein HON22_02690 [Candidatus Peregrinibacteria bacterium]|jgi:hypothetical protein|nr:hypothetical protein [Candidatus Peregrinibacteria bacterium]
MLKIALIDDKSYGIKQIKQLHKPGKYTLDYYETFQEFQKNKKYYDIIYLDYYLDKEGITGDTVVREVKKYCKKLIAFSSMKEGCDEIVKAGADEAILKIYIN